MGKHENINELLVDFALGELSQQQVSEVKTHLIECPQCSNELKRLEALLKCTGSIRELSTDAQTCDSAKQAIFAAVENEKTKHTSGPNISPASIWRKIMKSPITKLAAAAMIIIAAFIVTNQFGVQIDVTNVAWADVQKAFLAQSWVHLKYDNDTESWYNLKTGDHCHKQIYFWGDSFVYINRTDNLRQRYAPGHGKHITENRPTIYKDNIIPAYEPKTAWDAIVGHLGIISENVKVHDWEFERNIEQVDGKQLVRFDRYYNDAAGRRLLIKQIWADPQTRLPVKVWERLSLAQRETQNREYITGVFSFPEMGPLSIYDLGVPKDLPVVRNYDKIASPSVEQAFKAAKAVVDRFPIRYRVIVWQNKGSHEIDIIWRNGDKIRQSRYFSLIKEPYHLDVPCTAKEVLQWTQTQVPIGVTMVDGDNRYRRSNSHPSPSFKEHRKPEVRVARENSLMLSSWPHDKQWPYVKQAAAQFEIIQDLSQELSGCIGLRSDSGDIRREMYIDPAHDYICVKWIWWKLHSGNWEKERQYELSGFTRLPEGHWYASSCLLTTYADPERGTGQGGANWSINIEVLDEGDYPPDVFNGEKLLEGAKIETY
ncbi:MAG: hypothetical protein H8D56_25040 [Planctomycetes bacterium]|nr:hypothetical protein [Planctomycetota bacterium]MBL7144233.1 hypothetical protein [Phycisphaerae bacterium]